MDIYDVENTRTSNMDTIKGHRPANPHATKVTKIGIAPGLANTEIDDSDQALLAPSVTVDTENIWANLK